MKKIFVSDLDGSLLNEDKQISEATLNTLIQLKEQGHILGIATGRPYPSAYSNIPNMRTLFDFGVFNNGANTFDFADDDVHDQYPLSKEVIESIITTYTPMGGNPILFFGDTMYAKYSDDYTKRIESFIPIKYEDISDKLETHHEKIIFSAFGEAMERIENHAQNDQNPAYRSFKSQSELFEFTDPRINKWVGIEYYLKKHDLESYDVISFGDNDNDIEMIQHATVGIAMANATDAVLKVADRTTLSNDDEGVNAVLVSYLK